MKNPSVFPSLVLALLSLPATLSHAAEVWSESFDDPDAAKVGFNNGTASQYSFEDYSAMTLTSVNPSTPSVSHSIPAAPHTLPGSAATRGLLLRVAYETVTANPEPDPPTITATAVTERILNVVALAEKDGARLALLDNYRLSFDFYLRLSPSITLNATTGLPNEAGTTENMLWGIGYNASLPMARGWRTGRGNGMWGWLTTEGGYGTTVGSDASLYKGPTPLIARNLNKAAGVDVPDTVNFFTPAFGLASSPMPSAPANQWVQAVITVSGGLVTLEYKGEGVAGTVLTKFATNENGAGSTAGTVMVGYEDASGSKSFAELDQWMLLDNMVVEDIAPPTIAVSPDQPIVTFTGTPTSGTYLIANTQAAASLTVESVTFAGTNATDFSIVTPLPLVIPPGSTLPLEVRFNPAGPNGVKTATMTVASNDPQQPSYPPITVRARRSVGVFFAAHYKLDDTSGTSALNSAVTGSATFEVREPLAFSRESLIGGTGTSIGFLPAQTGTTGNYFVSTITHTPTYSISMWIKPEDTGTVRTLFQRDPDFVNPIDGIYGLLLNPDGSLTYRVADTDVVPGNISIPNGEIHHVVLTHLDTDGFGNTTSNRIRLYVDGQLAGQAIAEDAKGAIDYPLSPTASGLHFGSRTTAGNGYQGDMDDVQVFSAELSPEQIWDLYRHPGLTGPNAATLSTTAVTYTPPGGPGGATGLVNLTWRSNPSIQYSIISSTDLTNWTAPGVITAFGTPDSDTTSLSVPANGPLRYYRITAP